jgi:hypothetical protein
MEGMHNRAKAMVKSFIRFWTKDGGLRSFILKIHSLGFRSDNHDAVMKRLLKNKERVQTKFFGKLDTTPNDFVEADGAVTEIAI